MAWIESHQELARHPKTRRLARALGESLPSIVGRLHFLWWWALDFAQDGRLDTCERADIADAMLWEGDADTLWDALVATGFIDVDGEASAIHDWQDYAGRLLEKRRTEAERLRRYRQANKHETPTDAQRTPYETRTNVVTVPNRTVPNQDLTGEEPKGSGTVVVVSAPNGATTATTRHREAIPFQQLSVDAQTVVTGWREAFGKRAPPKLNPTQVAKLEAAVVDLGTARLLEAADWCAGKGLGEFAKTLSAAYTKRQRDEGQEYRNGHSNGYRNGASAVDTVDALAKYDG